MKCNDLRGAADAAWRIVTAANQYIVQTAPWVLAKGGKDAELDAALASLARCLYRMAVLASPLMPGKAEELWGVLGQPGAAAEAGWASLTAPPVTGARTRKPDGLFPRPEPTVST
jgi:methionyl-tRNA synthetase